MIKVRNLNKSFIVGNKSKRVLKDINLDFKKGNIYLIKGISGCGKTTLLNILAGLDTEFDGDVFFYKSNIKKIEVLVVDIEEMLAILRNKVY